MSEASATHEWSFRAEALAATHRWHIIVLFCLVGSLVGWLIAWAWPSPYRATKELFVGLNVSHSADDQNAAAHAGLPFSNANDYKNWQMSSLNSMIYMDSILDVTLTRLRVVDPYWQNVSRQDVADMLHVYWRNAGKWRLVAEHDDPVRAAQLLIAWQDVVVEQVHSAVAQAQSALLLNDELKATADEEARATSQVAGLATIRDQLVDRRDSLAGRPGSQALDDTERLQLQMLLDQVQPGEAWQAFTETFPPSGSANDVFRAWIEGALPLLETEIKVQQGRIDAMEQRQAELASQYTKATNESLGLSPELLVQKISDRKLEQTVVRPTGLAILIGAGVGLILWALIWLVIPAFRKKA
jgi:hypothetical protein